MAAPPRETFVASGFFALRTPLLPLAARVPAGDLAAPGAGDAGQGAALDEDRARGLEHLRALVLEPAIREALHVASPSLEDAIAAWLADPASSRARGVTSILVRYVARLSARATPFGLFSGCSTGSIGSTTRLALGARETYRRHTRLDMHYLCALADALARDPAIRARLRWSPSTGLYRSGGALRYAEARADEATRARTYQLVSVEPTAALEIALERARSGATSEDIAREIVHAEPDVSIDEAQAYVDQLIETQLLAAGLEPPITGVEPIGAVVAALTRCAIPDGGRESSAGDDDPAGAAAGVVDGARAALTEIDRAPLGLPRERYREIERALEILPAKVDPAKLFQVDLYKPAAGATLGEPVVREILRAVEALARIGGARHDPLRRFREDFDARYETREVPLVEALDEERGVGFAGPFAGSSEPMPLLDGIDLPGDPPMPEELGEREAYLLRRLATLGFLAPPVGRPHGLVWTLDPKDVEALTARDPLPLPDAFAAFATLVAPSAAAVDEGRYQVVVTASGPSGAILLGRFCHGDAELRRLVEQHLRAEEALDPDAVFAEIVHLPEGRLGNILCRPVLREHEIVYLGGSGVPPERRIGVEDLLVSVAGGRVTLRSRALGRRVVPRMTTAHNHAAAALGIYRFLCALQNEATPALTWDWGALRAAPFLPRVALGKAVLARATWRLHEAELSPLGKGDPTSRYRAVQALRSARGLPRLVALADRDNVLPVDLDRALDVESFCDLVKNRPEATLRETLPAADELCAEGPEGRFEHELVIPFVRRRDPALAQTRRDRAAIERRFTPGSRWLYVKLYTGTSDADAVLREVVAPVVADAREGGAAQRWFFIRYGDPEWHLRVRFEGDPARLLGEVLPALRDAAAPFVADGRIWRVQLDTYEREIERYGGPAGIEPIESIFEADSDAALELLEDVEGDTDARWRLALAGMHFLVEDLGLDLASRVDVLEGARQGFAAEFRVDTATRAQLGAKYRAERASLEALLAAPPPDALARRSERVRPLVAELAARQSRDELDAAIATIAPSLLHMHANRVLRAAQRTQELVLYDLLARLYDAARARARGGSK